MPKRSLVPFVVVIAAWLLYAGVTLTRPVSESAMRYGLTRTSILLLNLTILLPFLLTWIAGAYAAATLSAVAKSMPQKEDRAGFRKIALGIALMLGGLIATTLLGALRQSLADNAAATAALVIATNYLHVYVPLAAYVVIVLGTGKLKRVSQAPGEYAIWSTLAALGLAAFATAYVWLVFTNPVRQTSSTPGVQPTYYLPDAAIVVTIILPFLVSCAIGLIALYRLAMYHRALTGFVYKKAALNLMGGFLWLIFGSIFLQGLQSLGSSRFTGLSLLPLLVLVYVLLAALTGGYVLLGFGAKKLAAIEQVMSKYGTAPFADKPKQTV